MIFPARAERKNKPARQSQRPSSVAAEISQMSAPLAILHPFYVDHALAVARIVNPNNANKVDLHGGAGADFSTYLPFAGPFGIFVSNYNGHESQATRLKAGDFLVLPIMPDLDGFYRPWPADRGLPNDSMVLEVVDDATWLDGLSGQTIPNLYGGNAPITGRSVPRLRVVIYRVLRDYEP